MPHGTCYQCHNYLYIYANGYCGRCNEGWDGYLDLDRASLPTLERELGLARFALTTEEKRGTVVARGRELKLSEYCDKLRRVIRERRLTATLRVNYSHVVESVYGE